MKTLSLIFLVFPLSILFLSCDGKNKIYGPAGYYSVPFLAGSENIYSYSATLTSNDTLYSDFSDTISIRIISTNNSLGDYRNAVLMEGYSFHNPSQKQNIWYVPSTDSLVEIAYRGAGSIPVVMPKGRITEDYYSNIFTPYIIKKFLLPKLLIDDSVQWREDPRVVLKFPLLPGREWISFRFPFLQSRKVLGEELVQVHEGQFYCTKIRTDITWSGGVDTSLTWYDFVCEEGLILRTIEWRNIVITEMTNDSTGYRDIGFATAREEAELIMRKY